MAEENKTTESVKEEFAALEIIGAFLGIFGLAVMVAVFFTSTFHGRVTNLVCGLVLLICAVAAVIRSRRIKIKKQRAAQ